jgi:hypothetical protein
VEGGGFPTQRPHRLPRLACLYPGRLFTSGGLLFRPCFHRGGHDHLLGDLGQPEVGLRPTASSPPDLEVIVIDAGGVAWWPKGGVCARYICLQLLRGFDIQCRVGLFERRARAAPPCPQIIQPASGWLLLPQATMVGARVGRNRPQHPHVAIDLYGHQARFDRPVTEVTIRSPMAGDNCDERRLVR